MTNISKLFLILTTSVISINVLLAQENNEKKVREYFLSPKSISPLNVSISYKRQLKNNLFLRIGLVNLSVGMNESRSKISTSFPTRQLNFSSGLEAGLEFRKTITEKFTFFHGPSLNISYSLNDNTIENPIISVSQRNQSTTNTQFGIPYKFGLLYQFHSHFLVSVEISPGIFYNRNNYASQIINIDGNTQNTGHQYTSYTFNVNNSSGLLSIAYRL